jgi:glycosyltransferase 2 family protein
MAEDPPPPRRGPPTPLRIGVSLAFLAGVFWFLDAGALLARLGRMHPGWALLAVGISVGQVALLAWRWSFTARRLGIPLPFTLALREYYLGIFLNQVLPGGVVGDAARAWRHAGSGRGSGSGSPGGAPGSATGGASAGGTQPTPKGSALRGVILERATAQVIMTGVALASAAVLLVGPPPSPPLLLGAATALLLTLGTAGFLLRSFRPLPSRASLAGRFHDDARRAVLAPGALAFHLLTGFLAVASYLAVFLAAGRAVGVATPLLQLLPLVAPVLMTMLLPLSVAGWGLREGAAAALWGMVGLSMAEGVLVSMAYGVLVLVSSLPGGLVLAGAGRPRTRTSP